MKLYTDNYAEIEYKKKNIITLGKFDGVHLGHQRLIEIAHELKRSDNTYGDLIVFTFNLTMRNSLTGKSVKYLFDEEEKKSIMADKGIDILIECPFTDFLRKMEPEDFVKEILINRLNAGCIIIGSDFRFGYERRGNAGLLEKMSEEHGFKFIKADKLLDEDDEISASLIRDELSRGNIERVNRCLGFSYFVDGEVVGGNKLGRTFGFPTINQVPSNDKLLPPFGVYGSYVYVDGRRYKAITNIGIKPTITDIKAPVVESYLYDFDEDIYGKNVRTEIAFFMRPERKFESTQALINQVLSDKETRKNIS